MKGVFFCEFMDMVEAEDGLPAVDAMIEAVCPASGGAYTAVGSYDHGELLAYIDCLAARKGVPAADLQRAFGRHVLGRLAENYGAFFEAPQTTFELLATIDGTIHVEVIKLYPDAELPRFRYRMHGPDRMELIYRSRRPFAELAHGLIEATADHYGERIAIAREDASTAEETVIHFHLTRVG